MLKCFDCSKTIDLTNQSICLFKKNHYHEECCKMCTTTPKLNDKICNKKSLSSGTKKLEKSKGGPGKLNFNKLGTFEKNHDVNCKDCKKKIIGQRFLTNKIGEFRCKDCNSFSVEVKCFLCKVLFEKGNEFSLEKEIFKDDHHNSFCAKCIKIQREEKIGQYYENNRNLIVSLKQIQLKKTLHCDICLKKVTSEAIDLEGQNYCLNCFSCYVCKISLKYQKVYHEEKGLVCGKCKIDVNCEECSDCKRKFFQSEPFYKGAKNDHPFCIECYSKINKNSRCASCKKSVEND